MVYIYIYMYIQYIYIYIGVITHLLTNLLNSRDIQVLEAALGPGGLGLIGALDSFFGSPIQ